jgi:hypothetical protein
VVGKVEQQKDNSLLKRNDKGVANKQRLPDFEDKNEGLRGGSR